MKYFKSNQPFLYQLNSTAIPDHLEALFCPVWLCPQKKGLFDFNFSTTQIGMKNHASDVGNTFLGVLQVS